MTIVLQKASNTKTTRVTDWRMLFHRQRFFYLNRTKRVLVLRSPKIKIKPQKTTRHGLIWSAPRWWLVKKNPDVRQAKRRRQFESTVYYAISTCCRSKWSELWRPRRRSCWRCCRRSGSAWVTVWRPTHSVCVTSRPGSGTLANRVAWARRRGAGCTDSEFRCRLCGLAADRRTRWHDFDD